MNPNPNKKLYVVQTNTEPREYPYSVVREELYKQLLENGNIVKTMSEHTSAREAGEACERLNNHVPTS